MFFRSSWRVLSCLLFLFIGCSRVGGLTCRNLIFNSFDMSMVCCYGTLLSQIIALVKARDIPGMINFVCRLFSS